ncbi:MAG TPA: choice-of-anchor Q domain-containing protein [Bacteroidales bacterium]|nr:choice-of-anchor Q domain-containing protein [Bacteroidales bacterium]
MKRISAFAFVKLSLIGLFLILSNQSQASSIYANGPISFNTIWSVDTVKVIGDITVNSNVTLTINPGTRVIFQGHYKLNVNGRLNAVGNMSQTINFTINDTTGFSNISLNTGGWYGIRFMNVTSTDSSKLIYCSFTYGKASGTGDDANGGAVFVNNFSKLLIANCTFDHNVAKTNGGAIYLKKSNANIRFNSFISNKCTSGGGIYISSGAPSIFNNAFLTNFASNGGGGIFCTDTTLAKINGNLIRHNMGLLGGGMGCYNASPICFNNTLVFNKATHGGGLSCINASPTYKNSILYNNTGSGIGNQVALMTDLCDPNFYYCDIQGGFAAFGIQGTQTYTGQYLNNMAVLPQFEDTIQHNYLIKQTSPCMDAGTPDTTGLKLLSTDIAKKPRINMARIDIGAYERQQVVSVCGTISQNTVWDADTVKVTCNVVINNGMTLSVSPGVHVVFQGYYSITVNGRITANALPSDSIVFTAKNTTTGWGGIIFNKTPVTNDSSVFSFCRFSYAKNNTGWGGVMNIRNFSKIRVSNCLYRSNYAYSGGAIYAHYSSLLIKNSSFRYNTANSGAGKGGAIFCDSISGMKIINCLFAYNSSYSGGSLYSLFSGPLIKLSMISNSSANSGGGITCDTSNAKIINSIIVNNTATTDAGGIYINRCNPVITNSSVSYNDAMNGGAVRLDRGIPKFTNTILHSNVAFATGNQVYINDTLSMPEFYYCDVQGDTAAMGKNGFTHFHGTYQYNIDTIPAYTAAPSGSGVSYSGITANWSLAPCSNLFNKGKTDTTGLLLPTRDFGGNARIYANRIDIGAYELIKPHIIVQPTTIFVCAGDTAAFSVSVESSFPPTYLWQYSIFGIIWLTAPGDNNDSVYYINNVSQSQDGYYYRCVVSGTCSSAENSQSAVLIVNQPPTINTQPINQTICQNASASFSVTASGSNILYQWQQQPPASTWSNCTGLTATLPTYTITNASTSLNGYKFHCIITGDCEPDTVTIDALLTVKALPAITSQPSNQGACQGQNVTFNIVATGTGITLQWEESTDGGATWHTAPGVSTTSSYSVNGIIPSMNGYKYRCVISGDCSPAAVSNVVTLSVNTSPAITTHPQDANVCLNSDTSFRVTATGGNLTYQWEKKAPADTAWSNAPGPTSVSAIYQIDNASMIANGTWYRCRVQNTCPPAITSDSAQLIVHSLPTVYLGPDTSIYLYNESVDIDAGSGFASYDWSTGENTQTITIVGTVAGIGPHMYTVTVTDNWGCTATDNITVTVLDNTGISITESETNIHIYPNPADDHLVIDIKNNIHPVIISISNIDGQVLYSGNIEEKIRQKIIDISDFSNGVYFLSVTINGKTYKEKIIKL